MNKEEIQHLPIYSISPDPEQARKEFSEKSLRELADSIAVNGVILPIIVSPIDDRHYQIIAGERRWRASIIAKQTTIPAIIRDLEPFTRAVQSLIENVQRADLNPMEEADAYEKMLSEYELSHEELAERVGKSRTYITNCLRLLKLPEMIKDCLRNEQISNGHAKVLLGLNDESDMIYICGKIVRESWSVKQTVDEVNKLKTNKFKELANTENDNDELQLAQKQQLQLRDLENKLTRRFGTAVKLDVSKNKNGSLKIHFNDYEELDRILDLLGLTSR